MFTIQHAFIHIDVDNLRAVFYLLASDIQCSLVFFFQYQTFEFSRAGNIGALTDINKQRVCIDIQRFQAT